MSIDAIIVGVTRGLAELPRLNLEGRIPGESPGQSVLFVRNAPKSLDSFIGREIWGGSGELLIGQTTVAKRVGYCDIEWTGPERADLLPDSAPK